MIKDIGTIRKELDGFEEIEEIEIPNAFKKGNHIKYITQKNDEESFKWFKLAAEQGNTAAQNSLGCCYQNGGGVAKNEEEAVKW